MANRRGRPPRHPELKSGATPLSVDVSEWEQCLDAILSNGELKNLGDDLWGANRLDSVAGAVTHRVSKRYNRVERAAYLLVVSVADMVGRRRGGATGRRDSSMDYLGSCISELTQDIPAGIPDTSWSG